jgi:hypothetical protein
MENLPITKLLSRIDERKMVVPEFQRGFKWKQADIKKLLESLLLDYPIGSALLWRTKRGTMTYRPYEEIDFENEEDIVASSKEDVSDPESDEIDFVLDGQQRTTSIYKIFPRSLSPSEPEIEGSLKGLRFFLNLKLLGLPLDGKLKPLNSSKDQDVVSDAIIAKNHRDLRKLFKAQNPIATTPQRLADKDILSVSVRNFWLPLTRDFLNNKSSHLDRVVDEGKKAAKAELEEQGLSGDEINELIYSAFSSWKDWFTSTFQANLNNKNLPCIVVDNQNPEGLARIFETVNSTGMALSVFDLLVARLGTWEHRGGRMNLRNLLRAVNIEDLRSFDDYPSLGGTISQQVPRILALRLDMELKKGEILTRKRQDFIDHSEAAVKGISKSIHLLKQKCGIKTENYLPFKDALTLAAASYPAYDEGAKDIDFWEKIVPAFILCESLTEDWTSSTNTTARTSFKRLKILLSGDKKLADETYKKFVEKFPSLEDFLEARSQDIVYRATITWILGRASEDNDSEHLTDNAQLEDHHIFPKDWINNNEQVTGEASKLVNCVLNRMLVSKTTNRKVSARNPAQYLSEIPEASRASACIPKDYTQSIKTPITDDDFKQLLALRYGIIKEKMVGWVKQQLIHDSVLI